jgi:hypothetical protein
MTVNMDRIQVAHPRPAYKGIAVFWRTMFWGAIIALGVVSAVLGWYIHRTNELKAQNAELEEFCNRDVTMEVK